MEAYWKTQGQPWRREPEIDDERQKFLAERRSIAPYTIPNLFPFKDVKLSRADVEWLLATHENGRGPIDWKDEKQRERLGIDLRGADLRGEDLSLLPMACLVGGLRQGDDATIYYTNLQQFEGEIAAIHLEEANLQQAILTEASLRSAHLEKANLNEAFLEGADLRTAHLEKADLSNAHLEVVSLKQAYLEGVDLRGAFLSSETTLNDVTLSDSQKTIALFADIHWNDVNVAVIDWSALSILGDELLARQSKSDGTKVDGLYRIELYTTAVRAYRQLSVVLRNQGLNEEAARFAYRSQLMQRKVYWYRRKFGQYLFSLFLALISGYGYKPIRSFITYAIVISAFAFIYLLLGTHLAWNEAVVISMTAFHGRGFFPEQFKPGDPQALVAAIEAFVGLLIEVTFIATLTQRLFGK